MFDRRLDPQDLEDFFERAPEGRRGMPSIPRGSECRFLARLLVDQLGKPERNGSGIVVRGATGTAPMSLMLALKILFSMNQCRAHFEKKDCRSNRQPNAGSSVNDKLPGALDVGAVSSPQGLGINELPDRDCAIIGIFIVIQLRNQEFQQRCHLFEHGSDVLLFGKKFALRIVLCRPRNVERRESRQKGIAHRIKVDEAANDLSQALDLFLICHQK